MFVLNKATQADLFYQSNYNKLLINMPMPNVF